MADSQQLSFPIPGAVPAGCMGVELKQRAKPIPNCRGRGIIKKRKKKKVEKVQNSKESPLFVMVQTEFPHCRVEDGKGTS